MNNPDLNQHLSQITTLWTVVCKAHDDGSEARAAALQALVDRYGGAIQRYLYRALADGEAVREVYQEWALRLVSGKFRKLNPERGRFRDYLKTVLYHLIADFRKEQFKRRTRTLDPELEPVIESSLPQESDPEFLDHWRAHLLERAWTLLEQVENTTGQPVHTVLRLRAEQPQQHSTELAAELAQRLGKPVSAGAARMMLHRARERFADLLIEEVMHSLHEPTLENLQQELHDLDLLQYCHSRLHRRSSSSE